MGRNLDRFEESIRSSVEHFSFPYDQSAWSEMEARLDEAGSSGNQYGSLLAAAGFLLLSGLFFTILPQNQTTASLPVPAEEIQHGWGDAYDGTALAMLSAEGGISDTSLLLAEDGSALESEADASQGSEVLSQQTQTSASLSSSGLNAEPTTPVTSQPGSGDALTSIPTEGNDGGMDIESDSEDFGDAAAAPVIALSQQEVCAGEDISLSVDNMDLEGMSYLWIMGDGKFYPDIANPTHVYDEPGTWNISLSILDAKGKISKSQMKAQVVVHAKPNADFSSEFINKPGELPTVRFLNKSDNTSECTWNFGADDTTSDINPERSYLKRGKKMVKLTAVNDFGCVDETYRNIYIEKDYNLEAPLSLSTSSGSKFMPEALHAQKREFKLTVYNDKQPIFSTKEANRGWDGSLPNGEKAQTGQTYPWVVIMYNRYGEEVEYYSGELTITP